MGDPGYTFVGPFGIYTDGDAPQCVMLTGADFTNRSWAELILLQLGGPKLATNNNIENLLRWMTAENYAATWWGTAGANNPLNNGLGSGGGDGTGSYVDLNAAAYFVAKNLESPNYGYPAILNALQTNASPAVFSAAVVQSGWAGGHYGVGAAGAGQYTVAGRGLDYLSKIPVPATVTAAASHGTNPSATNGVGWDFAPIQNWRPPGQSIPLTVPNGTPDSLTDVNLAQCPNSSSEVAGPKAPAVPPGGPPGTSGTGGLPPYGGSGTGNEGTGNESTGDESTGDESTANESTEDESTGDEGTGTETGEVTGSSITLKPQAAGKNAAWEEHAI